MASDASETLVLDQCALFALRCAVGAAQDREVSSQEIIGALRTAAKWALAHRHDAHSREEGQLVLTALDTGECPPPSIGLMTQALQTLHTELLRAFGTCIEALKPALQNGGQRLQGFNAT